MQTFDSCNSDNFKFDITAIGDDLFKAMFIAMSDNHMLTAYDIDSAGLLMLYWHDCEANPLPYNMLPENAANLCLGWLKQCAYPTEPDHDGSNSKGWRIYNDHSIDVSHYVYMVVQPVWAQHGK